MLNPINEDSDLRSFFNYLFVEKGLSKNTVEAYRNDLNEYLKWINLQQISDYKLITEPQINDFIASLFKKNLKSTSVNRKISSLKAFYLFLVRKKKIQTTPLSEIITPKKEQHLPVSMLTLIQI